LLDFRKAFGMDSSREYDRFSIWLIRARLGEAEAATTELQSYLPGRATRKPDNWPGKVGRFLAGQLPEPDFLAAAKNSDSKREAGQLCEAYFYAGSKRLLAGDKATAEEYFQKSIATGQRSAWVYSSAAAELKLLKTPRN
jgi:lipoprotein NlpI